MNTNLLKNLAKKVGETAVHAAVFAYVSTKVSNFLDKTKNKKVRVDSSNENGQK